MAAQSAGSKAYSKELIVVLSGFFDGTVSDQPRFAGVAGYLFDDEGYGGEGSFDVLLGHTKASPKASLTNQLVWMA
jgi:hypothetical protein